MDVDVAGKKILLRCDFNVPQDKATGAITSDKRIVAALPTIRYLLERGAAVIACSHLGKPKGQWKESLTLAPVAERLSRLLGQESSSPRTSWARMPRARRRPAGRPDHAAGESALRSP